jgi:serine/threonine protein kinase
LGDSHFWTPLRQLAIAIMIDGRGQVFIMDFGLAAVADAIAGRDVRSGTPAYMAPEQREGREVTVRSDIYQWQQSELRLRQDATVRR